MHKLLWIKADWGESWEDLEPLVKTALESGADAVVVKPGDVQKVLKLGVISVVARDQSHGIGVLLLEAKNVEDVEKAFKRAEELKREGKKVALSIEVSNKELERAAVKAGKVVDFLIVSTPDWKVIPLENLIAELHCAEGKVLAEVKNAEEAKVAVETLEIGADGVLLDPRKGGVNEIHKVGELFEKLVAEKLELVSANVTVVKPVGMGDRACVDTTSLMTLGEGMLVGSQAGGMFLVHSETLPSEFVEPRPFRVNAGAVHAYIRLPGGKTKYMSELVAGDEVLIVNSRGECRVGVVGRVKIERRPLLLIEAEYRGYIIKTLLQNAETINLVDKSGKPISVAKLKSGDEVLVHVERIGRHFGTKVEETIVER